MQITSHFIGISIKDNNLHNLISGLSVLCGDSIVSQDVQSTHITLVYLPASIDINFVKLRHFPKNVMMTYKSYSYFSAGGYPEVYFLEPTESQLFQHLHQEFLHHFPEFADYNENKLTYVPHITLFHVRDAEKFEQQKSIVEEYINTWLADNQYAQQDGVVSLYAVDSTKIPETQKILYKL